MGSRGWNRRRVRCAGILTAGSAIDPAAFNDFEARGWEARAGGYHEFFGAITSRAIPALLDAAAVGSGTRLLDLASGPGYVAAAAIERGARVTGVDIATEMVALASRLHPGIDFVQGDAERLPFDAAGFDAVTANFAILHVGRPEAAAAEIARVLAPGGRVAMTVWDLPERSRLLGAFVEAAAEAGAPPPAAIPQGPDVFRFADEDEFAGLLEGAGLIDSAVSTVRFGHRLATAEQLWEGVLAGSVRTRALVEGQDRPTRVRIREAFDRISAEFETSAGIEVPVVVKLVSARRPE